MSYFLTDDDLDKAVDAVFSAVSRMFSEKDVWLNKRLRKMENDFLLLINTVGYKSHQLKNPIRGQTRTGNIRSKNMSEEPRAIRPFDEVLEDLIEYVLQSEDHDLIILSDELHESAKIEIEKREKTTSKLREIFKESRVFLKDVEGEKQDNLQVNLPESYEGLIEEKEKEKKEKENKT